ncbi:hypothetical protein JXQ31_03470 [candidate division KSB1 bacterium]|nr:hypothetical protein [candidate division KSB1 bacterium]
MKKRIIIYMFFFICFTFLVIIACTQSRQDKMFGTLRVSTINPRYFTDDRGQAVYLTGAHTWNNLVDMSPGDIAEKFDYVNYIHWMKKYNHNFIRLWAWELMNWDTRGNRETEAKDHYVAPHPWARTGPGNALDGKPKFDLEKWDPEYFDRLKYRVKYAADNGIYVSVMLFEGWGLQFSPNAFENHPFHPENNINGINGDLDGDGMGIEIHTGVNEEITSMQKNYVKKVIDTINSFDNVLYEISNENHPPSTDWQYDMISFIKDYEKTCANQHPVGMTFQYKGGSNQTLFDSPADWISPNHEGGYRDNPPPGNGSKVILTDTDHLWGIGGNQAWVWKSFLRGLNPIFMDCYDGKVLSRNFDLAWAEPLRKSLGYTLLYAQRMDLIRMIPQPDLASSTYCLANKGVEYLVYLPDGQEITVDLLDAPGPFQAEWFDPNSGEFGETGTVTGGEKLILTSPFGEADAVLYLKSQ